MSKSVIRSLSHPVGFSNWKETIREKEIGGALPTAHIPLRGLRDKKQLYPESFECAFQKMKNRARIIGLGFAGLLLMSVASFWHNSLAELKYLESINTTLPCLECRESLSISNGQRPDMSNNLQIVEDTLNGNLHRAGEAFGGTCTLPSISLTLEDLGYKYGTDKSRDDHRYVVPYAQIFGQFRGRVQNITELGVAAGQSLDVWHDFFPCAHVYGIDPLISAEVKQRLRTLHRITLLQNDIAIKGETERLGLGRETMDIVIEDALHTLQMQEELLHVAFDLVKPGGYYIVEDAGVRILNVLVCMRACGCLFVHCGWILNVDVCMRACRLPSQVPASSWRDSPENLKTRTRQILEENDAYHIDMSVGHRAWEEWKIATGPSWCQSRLSHNSNLVVIQKRKRPLPALQINLGRVAMKDRMGVDRSDERNTHSR
jgi:hypothetical protein